MDRLANVLELLDGPLEDPAALAGNLRDLRRINRWLGGVGLSASAWLPWRLATLGGRCSTSAPVAPTSPSRSSGGPDGGAALTITAVDSRHEVIAAAVRTEPALAVTPGLSLVLGDGLRLDQPDHAYDVAHCSLVLHHLDPRAAVDLLVEMARVARIGIVVNDLDRSRLAWSAPGRSATS